MFCFPLILSYNLQNHHYQINLEIVFDKYSIHSEELFNAHWIQLVPIKIHGETNIDNEVKEKQNTHMCAVCSTLTIFHRNILRLIFK